MTLYERVCMSAVVIGFVLFFPAMFLSLKIALTLLIMALLGLVAWGLGEIWG